ncbi:FAS1-like dehydratase domain-containing protein [Brevibacillus massiliensis]|uniref:FAS1-like dehydratase domain-containing protein n=1 Tax=Brevibacillus massiliensis TaxID=1118054 RepID=UPI0002E7EA38|nr:MaoC family dehydratase N-terminal domain-containing protein [Brevibacillus massiliensis]
MAADISKFVGREFAPYRLVVERGKIREFALAIGDDSPLYRDKQSAVLAGWKDVTIPPTFPTVIDMWGGPDFFTLIETLELDLLRVLHGEQEYEYLGEIYTGDEITGTAKVTGAKAKSGRSGTMKLFSIETVYVNQRGEMVCIGRSTVIEHGGSREGREMSRSQLPPVRKADAGELPVLKKPVITHTQLVRYAGASGDFNPIHTVVPVGEEAGLGGVIAHGMLIMGFAGQAVCAWFPRKQLRRLKARFADITRPGEQITVTGRVVRPLSTAGEDRLCCELRACNQAGEVKLKGEFEVAQEGAS